MAAGQWQPAQASSSLLILTSPLILTPVARCNISASSHEDCVAHRVMIPTCLKLPTADCDTTHPEKLPG